ncbi:hypothetical protein COE25_28555 [Bacillus sp. AFS031507]|nr:hypothetical protein COE25_28555 [Bacillus sp. AFS031507]
MISFFRKQFLEDRIKPILFLQLILVICVIIVYLHTFNRIDYFYSGILNIIVGVIFLLNGIEIYILKKSGYFLWLILSLLFL